ncbi:MAG: ABC transporter permease [Dehalococcoidia bacterium]|nr:ABC transporter permease [Dehalococcoidia bacterium]
MRGYILRRLLFAIPTLVGASLVIFLIMRVLPGDITYIILGQDGNSSGGSRATDIEALRRTLNLDRSLPEQYLLWVKDILSGSFGVSLFSHEAIGNELARRLPISIELALLGFLISLLIAVPIGVISALKPNSVADVAGRFFATLGLAIPEFFLATLMLFFLLQTFRWLPPLRYAQFLDNPANNLQQLFFPALALGIAQSASVMRLLRSQLLEVIRQDYIRTARAKGLRERQVVLVHALRNGLIPVLTLLGNRIGRFLGGALVLEIIFNVPGMGRWLTESIQFRDYPVVQAVVLIFAAVYVVVNIVVDISYTWLDPRIRYS